MTTRTPATRRHDERISPVHYGLLAVTIVAVIAGVLFLLGGKASPSPGQPDGCVGAQGINC
jgi:hypothetical protein